MNFDHPDLFPDMPKEERPQVTERQLFVIALAELKQRTGASTRQIAEFLEVPRRTVEQWVQNRSLPPDWSCRKLRKELRNYPV